jgi:hypothetical protein
MQADNRKGVGVFCTGKDRVVKITRSSNEVVLQTIKAHGDLSWFKPLLGGNSPLPSGLILNMNRCYDGVSRELKKFTW